MNFFKKNETLELKSQIEDLLQEKQELQKEIKDYRNTISSFVTVKASFDAEKIKLMNDHAKEMKQFTQTIEKEKKSVAGKVNRELARIGVSTFVAEDISPESGDHSPDAIINQWLTMPESPERHEFFKKYEKVIGKLTKK